jgi:hypothetical protein
MAIDFLDRDDLPSFSFSRAIQPVATKQQAGQMLERLLETTGLTRTKLSKLLGCTTTVVFNWYAGRRSPSQPYCIRIIHLLLWSLDGIPLGMVRTINWNTLEIEWLRGYEPHTDSRDDIPITYRAVPDSQRQG